MSNTEESNQPNQNQGQPSIGIYPAPNAIVLEINDGQGEPKVLALDPDDAGRIAVNLISNVVLFQLNQSMKQAAEKAEMERLRQMITTNKDPFDLGTFKVK